MMNTAELVIMTALERLARSSWGKQGIGYCPTSRLRKRILKLGYAKYVKGEPAHVMALTLNGFRALERWKVSKAISGTRAE